MNRLEEFVALVAQMPGMTVKDYAEAMEVAPVYLYRVRDRAVRADRITCIENEVDGTTCWPTPEGSR